MEHSHFVPIDVVNSILDYSLLRECQAFACTNKYWAVQVWERKKFIENAMWLNERVVHRVQLGPHALIQFLPEMVQELRCAYYTLPIPLTSLSLPSLQILDLSNSQVKDFFAITRLTDLRILSLENASCDWKDFHCITHLTRLEHLSLAKCATLPNAWLTPLLSLPSLRKLDLHYYSLRNSLSLPPVSSLRTLRISGSTTRGIPHLSSLRSLEVSSPQTMEDIYHYTQLHTLKLFSISYTLQITQSLKSFAHLSRLELTGCVPREIIRDASSLSSLRVMELDGIVPLEELGRLVRHRVYLEMGTTHTFLLTPTSITSLKGVTTSHVDPYLVVKIPRKFFYSGSLAFLHSFPQDPGLQSLSLREFPVTLSELRRIQSFPTLSCLKLQKTSKLHFEDVASIVSGLPQFHTLEYKYMTKCTTLLSSNSNHLLSLKSLSLKKCKYLPNSALASLSSLQSLTHLDLLGCSYISSEGLKSLTHLRGTLRSLNIQGTQVTPSQLSEIFPHLSSE